jgi:hypothetical protein
VQLKGIDEPLQEHTMEHLTIATESTGYELRFRSLFDEGRGYAFPCDAEGHVDIDALGHKARLNYFFARTVIGREVALPAVQRCTLH